MCFAECVRGPFRGTNRANGRGGGHVAGYQEYPGTSGYPDRNSYPGTRKQRVSQSDSVKQYTQGTVYYPGTGHPGTRVPRVPMYP
eukprot:2841036-Rhodomonas_salina.1